MDQKGGRGRFGSELKSRGGKFSASYKTSAMLLIYTVKSSESFGSEREKKNIRKKGKIHCHLRYGYFVTVKQIVMTIVAFLN